MTVPSVFLKLRTRNKTMDMTMSSIRPNRVEVVTSIHRRRRCVNSPKRTTNMKIEASIYLRIRNEEVKVHGKSNFRMPHKHGLYKFLDGQCFLGGGKLVSLAA